MFSFRADRGLCAETSCVSDTSATLRNSAVTAVRLNGKIAAASTGRAPHI